MHTVFALLCFVVVIHWLIFPYPSGLLHWHCGNLTIAPVPAKQPWWIWINTSCEFIMNDCITTTKQSTTKPCAYFLGYTVVPTQKVSNVQLYFFLCWANDNYETKGKLSYEMEYIISSTRGRYNGVNANSWVYTRGISYFNSNLELTISSVIFSSVCADSLALFGAGIFAHTIVTINRTSTWNFND